MKSNEIRVGVIRCDIHGVYYGALMDEHDPLVLRELNNTSFFYFYTQYDDPRKKMVPTVKGFRITKVWDEDRERAEMMSVIFGRRPLVCGGFEEVSDDVDLVFIADCNGDGSDHLALASPGICKGIPTFVDKPLASTLQDARSIVELARKHESPLLSRSILHEVPEFGYFKNRFIELGEPEFAVIKGGGTTLAGQIHAISLAQRLFGSGVESVSCMGASPLAHVHLNYGGSAPRNGVLLATDSGGTYHCAFYASAYSSRGAIHSPGVGDFEYPFGAAIILEKIKSLVLKRTPPVPYSDMLVPIAIVEAARRAQREGRSVSLGELI